MRKLYALLSGLCFALGATPSYAGHFSEDQAGFSYSFSTAGNTVIFTNISTIGSEPGTRKAFWSFGDGSSLWTPPLEGTHHSYQHAGTYNVCLKIFRYINDTGDSVLSAEFCKTIVIETLCRAGFERLPHTTTDHPLTVSFVALPWHHSNAKPVKICWSFGDGTDTCIQHSDSDIGPYVVSHIFPSPGAYEVCVKIFYEGDCEARKCALIEIERPDRCKAEFERLPVDIINNPLTVIYKAQPWHINGKRPARICWSFGDGTDTCINYPDLFEGHYTVSHTYREHGIYEVCVKIIYYGRCEVRKCKSIAVPARTCEVTIQEIAPSFGSLSRGLYAALASRPESRPVRICWKFGDGTDTCMQASSDNPPDLLIRHDYPAPGSYKACVRVVFANGCVAEDCKEIEIRNHRNLCGGFMVDFMTGPLSYKFKGFAIHIPGDRVLGYRWNFGDGSTAIGREVTHTYNHSGEYEVCLYIKTTRGCETRICKKIKVGEQHQTTLALSPNPVVDILHATFVSTLTEMVNLKLINSNGTVIRSVSRNVIAGVNNWDFDVSNLPPGVYSLVVQSPNQVASALFIKQ